MAGWQAKRVGMRGKFLLLAASALALAGAGLGAVVFTPNPPPPLPEGPQPALPMLRANLRTADRIQIVRGAQMVWLERRGQVWALSQAGGYPVQPDKAAALVDGLLALRLTEPATASPAALGVADPAAPAGAGTLVRVLGTSGAVLAAIILGPDDGPAYVRRPNHPTAWLAVPHVATSTDPADWTGTSLPLPDLDRVSLAPDAETDLATLRTALAALRFTAIRASPQIHATPVRVVRVGLADGSAVLHIGQADGQDWLQISGSSAWARHLAPYAFAVPPGSLMTRG